MTSFEDKLELQNIKYREEIARMQKSLRKKNKSIKDLNEAVKNIKSERDEWKVDANQLDKEKDEFIIENEKLKSQLQQQDLPVVPECVAGAIESIPDHYSAFEAIDLIKSKVETLPEENKDWLQVYNWLCEGVENQNIFALAFITGKYEVEKPQLFYLVNKLTRQYLYRRDKVSFGEQDYCKDRDDKSLAYCLFTQQEIDSMQTGSYEQIEVEK